MQRYIGSALLWLVVGLAPSSFAAVSVSLPVSNSTVASPVQFVASATTSTCSKGVASVGVYIDDVLTQVTNGTSLNVSLPLSAGAHKTVVEEWDYCGGATFTIVPITVAQQTGVWVTSPSNNSTVGSPVQFTATSNTSTCSKGVASMGVYINNNLSYVSSGNSLNTSLPMNPGTYNTVVEEWDYCGGASFTPIKVTVPGSTLYNLQAAGGWVGYGEFQPNYDICTSCGAGVTYSMQQGITSPSLSGKATQFNIGGSTPYSDVLWTNALIGDMSTQGLKDASHTLIPTLHNFTYDAYFYSSDVETSQALEMDVSQYFNGLSFIYGQQCRVAGGHEWDVWDNINAKWVPTGIACNPKSNAWNHVTIAMQRTWDNWIYFQSITLNGQTSNVGRYYKPSSVSSSWYGVTVNFQTDGNYLQSPYHVLLDQFNFTYW
jgi:hypothetical protein